MSSFRPKYQQKILTISALAPNYELGQKLSNFFVGILVETMTPKRRFEINWPLPKKLWLIFMGWSEKNIQNGQLKKTEFFKTTNSQYYFTKSERRLQYSLDKVDHCAQSLVLLQTRMPAQTKENGIVNLEPATHFR